MLEFKKKIIKRSGEYVYCYTYDKLYHLSDTEDVRKIWWCLREVGVDILECAFYGIEDWLGADHTITRRAENIQRLLSYVPRGEFYLDGCQFRVKYLGHILHLVFDEEICVWSIKDNMDDFILEFLERILQTLKSMLNDCL